MMVDWADNGTFSPTLAIARQLCATAERQREQVIRIAINGKMGREDWSFTEVGLRGYVIYTGHEGALDLFFDDKLLVRFGPVEFPVEDGYMTVEQEWEIYE